MVQTLFSNYSGIAGHKFKDEFELMLNDSNSLVIASGYFGASTLNEYERTITDLGGKGECKILIGMVYHAGVTAKQKSALDSLDVKLRSGNPDNGIYISRREFHGKIYLFKDEDNSESLYLGSSNFSKEGFASRNECTALINDAQTKTDVSEYLTHLFDEKLSRPLSEVDLRIKGTRKAVPAASRLLEDYKVAVGTVPDEATALGVCEIELRVDDQPASSLNLYFDKGRKNANGLYAPRPWYEVEITSSRDDRDSEYYPKSDLRDGSARSRYGEFTAYAEDNGEYYRFDMVVCSDYGKAIFTKKESGGRQTLGKFIKGKLERAGVLAEGERITSEVLELYGKSSIFLIKITDDTYILRF